MDERQPQTPLTGAPARTPRTAPTMVLVLSTHGASDRRVGDTAPVRPRRALASGLQGRVGMPHDRWSGAELCRHCLQAYAFELEVACAACDGPVCPLCVVQIGFEAVRLCPECPPGASSVEEA